MRPKTYIMIFSEICYFVYIYILQKMGKNCSTKIPTKRHFSHTATFLFLGYGGVLDKKHPYMLEYFYPKGG